MNMKIMLVTIMMICGQETDVMAILDKIIIILHKFIELAKWVNIQLQAN